MVLYRNRGDVFEGLVQRAGKLPPGGNAAVHVHHELAESHLVQSLRDCLDGGPLLGHEENALAPGNKGRDEVRYGL